MREDMAKVLAERSRIQARNARKGRKLLPDDLPQREGMRRGHAWRGDRKQLNEARAPLRRYLAAQVGRPWDKVYAEMCRHLDADNAVQQRVRDRLEYFVAITPRRNVNGWRSCRSDGLWYQPFYIDPVSGLLCRTDRLPEEKARLRARRNRPRSRVERVVLSPDREYRLLNGLWFEVRLAPMPRAAYRAARETVRRLLNPWIRDGRSFEAEMEVRRLVSPPVFDIVSGKLIEVGPPIDDPDQWKRYRRAQPLSSYAVAKRALSRKELRQAGLRSGGP